jgi:hypothetical protein
LLKTYNVEKYFRISRQPTDARTERQAELSRESRQKAESEINALTADLF